MKCGNMVGRVVYRLTVARKGDINAIKPSIRSCLYWTTASLDYLLGWLGWLGWVWLGVVGCGWVWLGVVGYGLA